ncbi:MAG: bifunctional phosphopantothenoylcysteine decarboxylase/phosphopantothenate--cysteine ligase CoaBC [Candidatus Levybacteria bacterium]|nr:bifunctional phosphopantothenoylcysteine decarboxylase/phosphopantothenate--cysteine ligase CoaBC [Candidatus Levybacteria bacterium]
MKRTVVLGISGGIAAYKSLELIKELRRENINVFVIMTNNAAKMVPAASFEKASEHKVYIDLFEKGFNYKNILKSQSVDHIDLAKKADLLVIAPATANTIAKLAYGLADDFLTTTFLATTAPVIICPSMNVNMWNNPVVQQNIETLKKHGYQIIDPDSGELACGNKGAGRLAEITKIKKEILRRLTITSSLKNKKVIVTAGGTIEKIDDIRYIANRSSGKMGIAIAEECYLRGADVLLFRSKSAVKPRYLINEKIFTTADDLLELIKQEIRNYDIFYHTAAVSDFKIENPFKGKISSKKSATIKLKPRQKILDQIKKLNPDITLIAFKAEYGLKEKEMIKKAYNRLKESNADLIVANDVSKSDRGFESDFNEVFIIQRDGKFIKIPYSSKNSIAKTIVDHTPNS